MNSNTLTVSDITEIINANSSSDTIIDWISNYSNQPIDNVELRKGLTDIRNVIISMHPVFKYTVVVEFIDALLTPSTVNISEKQREDKTQEDHNQLDTQGTIKAAEPPKVAAESPKVAAESPKVAAESPMKYPDDPMHVLNNMYLYTTVEILKSIEQNPKLYSSDLARDILGYYIDEYRNELHKSDASAAIVGMLFNVPKILIDRVRKNVQASERVITYLKKYETDEFNLEEMLINITTVNDFTKGGLKYSRDYIIAALGYEKILSLGDKTDILPQKQREYHMMRGVTK
jgi:hypothetical protein